MRPYKSTPLFLIATLLLGAALCQAAVDPLTTLLQNTVRYINESRYPEAIAEAEQARRLAEASQITGARLGMTYYDRGFAYAQMGRETEAQLDFQHALQIYEKQPGTDLDIARTLQPLAMLQQQHRDFDSSERLLKRAL